MPPEPAAVMIRFASVTFDPLAEPRTGASSTHGGHSGCGANHDADRIRQRVVGRPVHTCADAHRSGPVQTIVRAGPHPIRAGLRLPRTALAGDGRQAGPGSAGSGHRSVSSRIQDRAAHRDPCVQDRRAAGRQGTLAAMRAVQERRDRGGGDCHRAPRRHQHQRDRRPLARRRSQDPVPGSVGRHRASCRRDSEREDRRGNRGTEGRQRQPGRDEPVRHAWHAQHLERRDPRREPDHRHD